MKIEKNLMPIVYFVLGASFAVMACFLSQQSGEGYVNSPIAEVRGTGIDIAADGGACGFAILSGICFCCSCYLMKGRD